MHAAVDEAYGHLHLVSSFLHAIQMSSLRY